MEKEPGVDNFCRGMIAAGGGWQGCPDLGSRWELVLGSGEPWRGSAWDFTENMGGFFPPSPLKGAVGLFSTESLGTRARRRSAAALGKPLPG